MQSIVCATGRGNSKILEFLLFYVKCPFGQERLRLSGNSYRLQLLVKFTFSHSFPLSVLPFIYTNYLGKLLAVSLCLTFPLIGPVRVKYSQQSFLVCVPAITAVSI